MRTKALLLAAAVTVGACATSMAQVYSANAVGYVNITIENAGFAMFSNPLNGTNNNLNTILPLPDAASGATVYKFDAATQNYVNLGLWFGAAVGWFPADGVLNPGEGAFIDVPPAGVPLNITFVGEVPQGQLSLSLGAGFNLVSSQVPQALPLGAEGAAGTLNFPAADGDTVYFFDNATQGYVNKGLYFGAAVGWFPPDPQGGANGPVIPVAGAFFVSKSVGAEWTRDFSVN